MNSLQEILPVTLKIKTVAAFRDNKRLLEMSDEEREASAQAFDRLAELTNEDNGRHGFAWNAAVTLLADYSALNLPPGSQGVIEAWYNTEPPSYEVTFRDADGEEFGMPVSEDEIMASAAKSGATFAA